MKKLYYAIGEASQIVGVEPHQIRYWETKIPQLKPHKSKNGKRLYQEKDLTLMITLKELVVDQKISLEGALEKIKSAPTDTEKVQLPSELIRDLKEIRTFLNELKTVL